MEFRIMVWLVNNFQSKKKVTRKYLSILSTDLT